LFAGGGAVQLGDGGGRDDRGWVPVPGLLFNCGGGDHDWEPRDNRVSCDGGGFGFSSAGGGGAAGGHGGAGARKCGEGGAAGVCVEADRD